MSSFLMTLSKLKASSPVYAPLCTPPPQPQHSPTTQKVLTQAWFWPHEPSCFCCCGVKVFFVSTGHAEQGHWPQSGGPCVDFLPSPFFTVQFLAGDHYDPETA